MTELPLLAPPTRRPPPRRLRVALVNLPWARVDAPSIQCGLLKSVVRQAGHDCDVHYLNLDLAGVLGHAVYDGLAEVRAERLHLFGEWLFSFAAFGEVLPEAAYLAEFPEVVELWEGLGGPGELVEFRRQVLPAWLGSRVAAVDWAGYDVVGLSSTFLQNTASLAFGRLVRERFGARPVLVYGGANFDGEMGAEYARHLPWIDQVVSGEGDLAFPALLDDIARGTGAVVAGESRIRELDTLPVPDYHEYFTALDRNDRSVVLADLAVKLPVEFSRGCWWGEKHHCTFCGLNALGMAYRAKSPERALSELRSLLSEYPAVHVEAVDNILDMKYLTTVCAELAEHRWDMSVFFEIKANLAREQLRVLHRAGITRVQPGIESLSSNVLRQMRKGSSTLINVRLLKWARYYGMVVEWNMLTGFPGETDADYTAQAELVPLLHHLQPPSGTSGIWLERFSPYFTDPTFPITNVRPRASYRHIYPAHLDHTALAYFFDYDAADTASEQAHQRLTDAVETWRGRWDKTTRPPSLVYQRLPGRLTLIDRRTDNPRRAVLTGWQADAYEACGDAPRTAARLTTDLTTAGHHVTDDQIATFLARCVRSGVMIAEDGRHLTLALPENPGW